MTKLIFTSRYLKDAKPSQKENYVHYIGTRKGVEKIDTSKKHLPATVSQKKLVHQLLQDFPATKEMLEYEDYQRKPTIENASEFIFCALEQNLDIAATRKNYVDYLAHRPRVEKIGEHGLQPFRWKNCLQMRENRWFLDRCRIKWQITRELCGPM